MSRPVLNEKDQLRYAAAFALYLKGSAGRHTYRIKSEEYEGHLQQAGELMHQLMAALSDRCANETAYQVLARVFDEHFVVEESTLRPKAGEELTADRLPSPNDWKVTYRRKGGEDHIGYVANVTETSAPENPFPHIVQRIRQPLTDLPFCLRRYNNRDTPVLVWLFSLVMSALGEFALSKSNLGVAGSMLALVAQPYH